jgi:hypothetical protein
MAKEKPLWQVVLLPKKGHTIGYVEAGSESAAINAAIKEFNVTEEEQGRLVVRRTKAEQVQRSRKMAEWHARIRAGEG